MDKRLNFKNRRLNKYVYIFFVFLQIGTLVNTLSAQNTLIPASGSNTMTSNGTLCTHAGCGGTYSNNVNGYTVLSNNGAQFINISGSYSTESCCDFIRIYSGVGTSGTVKATYNGTGSINYTSLAGETLTVQFYTDYSVLGSGLNSTVTYTSSNTIPGSPTSLSATPNSTTTANINWAAGSPVGSPAPTYYWSVYNSSNTLITSGSTTGTVASLNGLTANTVYYFKVYSSNINGTSATATSNNFTTYPSAPNSISATSSSLCSGSSTTLTAAGAIGTVYWYSGSCGGTLVGTGNSITVSPAISTTYFAKNYNGNYSSTCASLAITVNPSPNVYSITGNTSVCTGSTTTLSSSSSGGVWNSSNTSIATINASGLVTPVTAGTSLITYTVTSGGCSTTVSQTMTVYESQAAPTNVTATPSVITSGGNVNLNATATEGNDISWYTLAAGGTSIGGSKSGSNLLVTPFTTTTYYAEAISNTSFYINSLTSTGSAVVDHNSLTGDDRGGIAVTSSYYYYTGDSKTVRYNMPGLTSGVAYTKQDGLFSDLSGNGTLYTLWNGTAIPNAPSSYTVSGFRTLNSDLTLGSTIISLSVPITMTSGSGIYAGYGFVILQTGNKFYRVDIPSGTVTLLGTYTISKTGSENWATWGVAERNGSVFSVLFTSSNRIKRLNLSTGAITDFATFANGLSDMACFTYAPWNNRWYFHYEGSTTTFGGSAETAGYATGSHTISAGAACQFSATRTPIVVTVGSLPALATTTAVTNVSVPSVNNGTALSGGNVTSSGTLTITARGVVWGTTTNPTISLSTKTTDGVGSGIFTSTITGLNLNTTYYVRSYATNSLGTSYGAQVSFTPFVLGAVSNINKTYGDPNFSLTNPSSPSSGTFSYTSSNTNVVTISGNVVTIRGAGVSTITVTQAASGSYASQSTSFTINVSKANQYITLSPLPTSIPLKDVTGDLLLTATVSTGLPVTITLGAGSVANLISSNGQYYLKDIQQFGSISIISTQVGNDNYNSATYTRTIDVTKSNQTITFNPLTSLTYLDGLTQVLSASSSSTLSVSFSVLSGPASIASDGITLDISGSGDIVIEASQAGNSSWNTATSVTRILTVNKPVPVINSFTPSSAASGGTITITGNYFSDVTGVSFGGTNAASFRVQDKNTIIAIIAGGSSGVVNVTTLGGAVSASGFIFLPPPTIATFSPLAAGAGSSITITGSNFLGATNVNIGGVAVSSFTIVNNTTITAIVPSTQSGDIEIITTGGSAIIAGFSFILAPIISSFDGLSAAANDYVTIYGSNFTGATAVSFGGIAAKNFTVDDDGTIFAQVNNGTSGAVSVTTSGGVASLSGFSYLAPVGVPPTISNIGDQLVCMNLATGALAFQIGTTNPAITNLNSLVVSASSDNIALIPDNAIVLLANANGADYTATITPLTSQTGVARITLIVKDPTNDLTTSTTFLVTVNALPAIVTQPSNVSQTNCLNGSATNISVNATGAGLTYQWYVNTISSNSGGVSVAGATNAVFTPTTNVVGTKYYYVTITGTCSPAITSSVSGAVVVNTLAAPTAINLTTNYDGLVKSASATAPSNATITWYDAATAGSVSQAPSATNVGTYKAWAQSISSVGCDPSPSRTEVTLVINSKTITITANASQSKIYGQSDPLTYTYSVSPTITGMDPLVGSLTRAAGESAGNYIIYQNTLNNSNNPNYNITYSASNFTIAKKALTVTATGPSKTYGVALTAGTSASSFTYTGTISGEAVSSVTLTPDAAGLSATTAAGTSYIVTPSLATGTGGFLESNYLVTYNAYTGTVSKSQLIVTALTQNKIYGTTSPTSGILSSNYTVTGLLNNDRVNGVSFQYSGTPAGNLSNASVGIYLITPHTLILSQGNLTDYDIVYTTGNLTINKAPITINIDAKVKSYGDLDPSLTYQIASGNILSGDLPQGTFTRTVGEGVGTYTITIGDFTFGNNYDETFNVNTLTINKLPVTITADPKFKLFRGNDPDLTYTASPSIGTLLPNGELIQFTGNLSRSEGEQVNSYPILQNNINNPNLDISYIGNNFVIRDISPIISFDKTYTFTKNTNIGTLSPIIEGSNLFFSVDSLPLGLSINSSNGQITGTPLFARAQSTYLLYATNTAGVDTAILKVTILPDQPQGGISLVDRNLLKSDSVAFIFKFSQGVAPYKAIIYNTSLNKYDTLINLTDGIIKKIAPVGDSTIFKLIHLSDANNTYRTSAFDKDTVALAILYPVMLLQLNSTAPTLKSDGNFDLLLTLKMRNIGQVDLSNLQIDADLSKLFEAGFKYTIDSIEVSNSSLRLNPNYTGLGVSNTLNSVLRTTMTRQNYLRSMSAIYGNYLFDNNVGLSIGEEAIIKLKLSIPKSDNTIPVALQFSYVALANITLSNNTTSSQVIGELSHDASPSEKNIQAKPVQTIISLFPNPNMGSALQVSSAKAITNGFEFHFIGKIANLGNTNLDSIDVFYSLADAFKSPDIAFLKNPPTITKGNLVYNSKYDGLNNTLLLHQSNNLPLGDSISFEFDVVVNTAKINATWLNQLIAKSFSTLDRIAISDTSVDGLLFDPNKDGLGYESSFTRATLNYTYPVAPVVENLSFVYGTTPLKTLRGLLQSYPTATIPVWCDMVKAKCDTVAPVMPKAIGRYIYELRSFDPVSNLYSIVPSYDTIIVKPTLPIVKNRIYIIGLTTNPADISAQVIGLSNSSIRFYIQNTLQNTIPNLLNVPATITYGVSQIVNGVEGDKENLTLQYLTTNEVVHLQKIAASSKVLPNGLFEVNYQFVIQNLINDTLTSVSLKDDLASQLPIGVMSNLSSIRAWNRLQVNNQFNGKSNMELLQPTSFIIPRGYDTVHLQLHLDAGGYAGLISNQANLTVTTPYGVVAMNSSDKTKAIESSKMPTVFTLPVLSIKIAEGFSPNNDGIDDKWVIIKPFGTRIAVRVYNRWGAEVYSNVNYQNNWDGRADRQMLGDFLPEGTYYYIVESFDSNGGQQKFNGSLTIVK